MELDKTATPFSISMPSYLREELQLICEQQDVGPSEFIRRAVRLYICHCLSSNPKLRKAVYDILRENSTLNILRIIKGLQNRPCGM